MGHCASVNAREKNNNILLRKMSGKSNIVET